MLVDGFDERADIRRVLAPYDRVRQRFIVVYRVEFALEVLFEHVRVVNVLDGAFEYHRLLLGEVDELRDVAEMGRFLVETDAVAALLDDESRFAEGVDVAVNRPARHLQPLGQLVDVVCGVCRQQFHQPQQAFEFGLVHDELSSVFFEVFAKRCV